MVLFILENMIYNMDCLQFMRQLPDGFVQLILTDPPYGIQYRNNFTLRKHPSMDGDKGIEYGEFAKQSYRILQNNSHAYFFTRYDQYPLHYQLLVEAGFTIKNCLVIEKGHIGGIGDLFGSYANNSEWIIFCHKGRRVFNKTRLIKNTGDIGKPCNRSGHPLQEYKTRFNCCWFGSDYPKSTYNSNWKSKHGVFHPTVKNVECLEWLIRLSSNERDIIFDPFMGSGSTALAAKKAGRRYLGCEISTEYYQLSLRRLSLIE